VEREREGEREREKEREENQVFLLAIESKIYVVSVEVGTVEPMTEQTSPLWPLQYAKYTM
jgi:hypothetical protein